MNNTEHIEISVPGASGSILIVDDEVIFAMDLQIKLEDRGYRVTGIAGSAFRALSLLGRELPDCIFLDVRLAGEVDGIELAEKIREDTQVPIVFITGYADEEVLKTLAGLDHSAVLMKPFTESALDAVLGLLPGNRQ